MDNQQPMDEWDETASSLGYEQKDSNFVTLKVDQPVRLAYISHEKVPPSEKELKEGWYNTNEKDQKKYTFLYKFKDPETGKDKELRRNSLGIFFAFKNVKPQEGEILDILATGEGDQRRYAITKVTKEQMVHEQPATTEPEPDMSQPTSEEENINIEDIPF